MLKDDRYAYRVTWSEEDQEYVGLCVEFPSLSWLAGEPEEALAGIREVVAECVCAQQSSRADGGIANTGTQTPGLAIACVSKV